MENHIYEYKIQLIDSTINLAIQKQEKEYLEAYKSHIHEVQNDIDEIKEEADDFKQLKKYTCSTFTLQ